jgi:hypothetical protein
MLCEFPGQRRNGECPYEPDYDWMRRATTAAAVHRERTPFITVQGVVKEVWFNNPHIRYYVAVTGEDGSEVVWDAHGAAPNRLIRSGWNESSIKVGDEVTLIGNPMHDRTPRMNLTRVVLADGTTLPRESR